MKKLSTLVLINLFGLCAMNAAFAGQEDPPASQSFHCNAMEEVTQNRFEATGSFVVGRNGKVTGEVSTRFFRQGSERIRRESFETTGKIQYFNDGAYGPGEVAYLNLQLGDKKTNRLMMMLNAASRVTSKLRFGIVEYRGYCFFD